MKQIYLIGGPMGIGKTTLCQQLKEALPNSVFLDGDWCWDMNPFQVTDETKKMVMENITFLLNQFIRCSAFEHVVFCWVMHQQAILDDILSRLSAENCQIHLISLVCQKEELERRVGGDIQKGLRDEQALENSLSYLPLYDALSTLKVDVTGLTPQQSVEKILALTGEAGHTS